MTLFKRLRIWKINIISLSVILFCLVLFQMLSESAVYGADVGYSVNQSTDDTVYRYEVEYWGLDYKDVLVGAFDAANYKYGSGLRFQNVEFDTDDLALINSVVLRVTSVNSAEMDTVYSRITAEDIDNAGTFVDNSVTYLARYANHTTAVVDWDIEENWIVDTQYDSPDIKSIITEVFARPGWVSGNDIVIFWTDYDDRTPHEGARVKPAYAYDNIPGDKVLCELVFDYVGEPSAPSGFEVIQVGMDDWLFTWDTANVSSYYTIRGEFDEHPTSNISGWFVYSGTSTNFTEEVMFNEYTTYYTLFNIANEVVSEFDDRVIIGGEDLDVNVTVGLSLSLYLFFATMVLLIVAYFIKSPFMSLAVFFCTVGLAIMPDFTDTAFQNIIWAIMAWSVLATLKRFMDWRGE